MRDTTDEVWVEDLARRSRAAVPPVAVDVDAVVVRGRERRRRRLLLRSGSVAGGLVIAVLGVPMVSDAVREEQPAGRSITLAQPAGAAEISPTGPDCLADDVLATLRVFGGGTITELGLDHLTGGPTAPAAVTPGTVPRGFEPTSVVLCRRELPTSRIYPAVIEEVWLDGDLGDLVEALDLPSEPIGGLCSAVGRIPPQYYLVDAEGRAIRPALPIDRCGDVRHDVGAALAALTETEVVEHRGQFQEYERSDIDAAAARLGEALTAEGIPYEAITPTANLDGLLVVGTAAFEDPAIGARVRELATDTTAGIRVLVHDGSR